MKGIVTAAVKSPHLLACLNIAWIIKYEWTRAVGCKSLSIARSENLNQQRYFAPVSFLSSSPFPLTIPRLSSSRSCFTALFLPYPLQFTPNA